MMNLRAKTIVGSDIFSRKKNIICVDTKNKENVAPIRAIDDWLT